MGIAKNMKLLRERAGMTQTEFGRIAGVSDKAVSTWELGIKEPRMGAIQRIADHFGLQKSNLIEEDGLEDSAAFPPKPHLADKMLPLPPGRMVPLLGTIACGIPVLAQENWEEEVSAPEQVDADFALRCTGDSMMGARILDGDIVYIHQQPDVENGEIAAVLIDNEATLKRVHRQGNRLVLNPENPSYAPLIYTGSELEQIHILGKAVAFLSSIR